MSNQYFDNKVDEAIIKFQLSEDEEEREYLCKEYILPAFKKMASYWYGRLSLRRNEETIHDCVAYLYEKIPMFDSSKKTRGFAYFNMIARHWFFQKLKYEKRENSIDVNLLLNLNNIEDEDVLNNSHLIDDQMEFNIEKKEFLIIFKETLPKWRERAYKENEIIVIDALIQLFNDVDQLDLFKKKSIFENLREITGLKSKQIASILVKLKKKYRKLREAYLSGEI